MNFEIIHAKSPEKFRSTRAWFEHHMKMVGYHSAVIFPREYTTTIRSYVSSYQQRRDEWLKTVSVEDGLLVTMAEAQLPSIKRRRSASKRKAARAKFYVGGFDNRDPVTHHMGDGQSMRSFIYGLLDQMERMDVVKIFTDNLTSTRQYVYQHQMERGKSFATKSMSGLIEVICQHVPDPDDI